MTIIIFTKEELIHNVLIGFKNNFVVSSLGRLHDMLLNEVVDMLAAIFGVAVLDEVQMVAWMNASTLNGVIVVDVNRQGTINWKGLLGEATKISIINDEHVGGSHNEDFGS